VYGIFCTWQRGRKERKNERKKEVEHLDRHPFIYNERKNERKKEVEHLDRHPFIYNVI